MLALLHLLLCLGGSCIGGFAEDPVVHDWAWNWYQCESNNDAERIEESCREITQMAPSGFAFLQLGDLHLSRGDASGAYWYYRQADALGYLNFSQRVRMDQALWRARMQREIQLWSLAPQKKD